MKKLLLILLFIPIFNFSQVDYRLAKDQKEFLDTLQRRTFNYFLHEVNEKNGLVKDRSTKDSPASIAAVGFGLPTYAIAAEKGWIERKKAYNITLATLKFYLKSEQSKSPSATGYKGFYYHFLKMNNGKREWKSELSSIDTAWLLAGLIFCRQYYSGETPEELEIRKLSTKLIERVDWNFMQLKDGRFKYGISLGWSPEEGFHKRGWHGYDESLFIYILAAGSGMKNPTEAYNTWLSTYVWQEPYQGLDHLIFPPMFGHQYTNMFIDFRNLSDKYMREKGIDYFENSRRAVLTQQRYAIENPLKWKGYGELMWGLSACDGPEAKNNKDGKEYLGYAARGTSGRDSVLFDDGTLAPTAVAASLPFAPEVCLPTLENMKVMYGDRGLWDKYGFQDAFNPTAEWIATDCLGIDQAPIIIMIENFYNGLVWKTIMKDPIIKKGLEILDFQLVRKE